MTTSGNGVAVVGSANADLVVQVDRRPAGGETLLGGDLQTLPGGKGANQAAAAALSGARTVFVGAVGADGHGEFLRDSLTAKGVDLTHLMTGTKPTGTALIFLTPDGENSIVVSPGANAEMTPELTVQHAAAWRNAACVVLSLEIPMPTVTRVAADAAEHGTRVIVNAAPASALEDTVLGVCDPLIVNEHEACEVLGIPTPEDGSQDFRAIAADLIHRGAKSVVITLGSEGAIVAQRGQDEVATKHLPAFHVKPVDTTGAGDAFVGACAAELAAGSALTDAVHFAQAMAAISVERLGAQSSYVTREETLTFLERQGLIREGS